ncbi:type II toxin-antitoxin system VapC family toxin [Sandarakinorhabdus sp.]|uniref:type II toxin-antitoxin system VapC family toxin n=1 Tax=Sandarakinorhabdus sp. TaxID=1916663 RepID=UPI003F72AD29
MLIDASVAFKLIVPESGYEAANALVSSESLTAPDLIFAELANALWRFSQRNAPLNWSIAAAKVRTVIDRVVPTEDLMPVAIDIAVQLNHPAYDCFYLALAIAEQDVVITADRRFHAACAASPHAARVRLLG